MDYQILVLDLDGTLTNSKKEITQPTLEALIEIQEAGKKVVLASGRPTQMRDSSSVYWLDLIPDKICSGV